ncbi:C2 domain-containing protein [Mucor velutinosus]|uniref:C2 domain-containing protein n=1 Tax=Mucor velutinosus TaxID=708070 RepID=A0AAN7DKF8_9FUNG|nr:C2 domain-containing protein [Mucor velutinosus]
MDDTAAHMDLDLELDAELERELAADLESSTTAPQATKELDVKPKLDMMLVGDEPTDRFEALPRPTAIFLHGVDEMSTTDITTYTNSPLLVKVEWINDSSCNLAFKTKEDASQVAQTLLSQPVPALDHRTLVAAKPFQNHPLSIRIATDEDIKERGARERSRYYLLHGVEDQPLSEDRREARKAHVERMQKNGGDGRDVFSRLGSKVPPVERRSSRNRSRSPARSEGRSIKRERSVEREIPNHLKSRLGMAVKPETMATDETEKEPVVKDEML